jgi:hypothetical protein
MLTIGIDCGDQRPKGHAALAGDLLQTVPELVFKADARLVAKPSASDTAIAARITMPRGPLYLE